MSNKTSTVAIQADQWVPFAARMYTAYREAVDEGSADSHVALAHAVGELAVMMPPDDLRGAFSSFLSTPDDPRESSEICTFLWECIDNSALGLGYHAFDVLHEAWDICTLTSPGKTSNN